MRLSNASHAVAPYFRVIQNTLLIMPGFTRYLFDCIWSLEDVCMICIWSLQDAYMIFTRCLYDLYKMFIWFVYDPYMIWSLQDVCMIFTRCLYDLYMILTSFPSVRLSCPSHPSRPSRPLLLDLMSKPALRIYMCTVFNISEFVLYRVDLRWSTWGYNFWSHWGAPAHRFPWRWRGWLRQLLGFLWRLDPCSLIRCFLLFTFFILIKPTHSLIAV
jgi:hypothetical protein